MRRKGRISARLLAAMLGKLLEQTFPALLFPRLRPQHPHRATAVLLALCCEPALRVHRAIV